MPLTSEQQEELDALKVERNNYMNSEKIKSFKELAPHVRQKIVDEACIYDSVNAINNIDYTNLEGNARYNELIDIQNSQWGTLGSGSGSVYDRGYEINSIYSGIIRHFSKEELVNAHAEVTIEEELGAK